LNSGLIEHRAAKVSLVNGLSTILSMGFQLVSVPICIHYWGRESYGSWLALYSGFMLLRSLDGGYTVFVGNKLNYLYHQSAEELHRHLASAVFGIIIISVLQLALVVGTLLIDPFSTMLGISGGSTDALLAKYGLLILMVSWVLSGSYLGIVHRLLIPAGLMYQAAWWAMEFQVSQFAAIMLAALLKLNLLHTSLLFALSQFGSYAASAWYVRRKLAHFSPWLKGSKARVGLIDLRQSLVLTTSNLVQQGATNGAVLLVSALAGPVAVPVFTTVRTLTNLWTSVTTVLSTPLLPDVVRLHVAGEVQKLAAINQAFWVLVGSAVNLGALLTYPLIPFLYGQWTAHKVVLDTPLLCLLLGSVVVANAGALMALHLSGINSLRIGLGASVARAVCGLGGGALGFRQYGLAGFGLGILVGEIIATLMTGRYFVKHEVGARGRRISPADFAPVSLSTGSVLLYFIGAAFEWWSVGWVWILALAGVIVASLWGWKTSDPALQLRMKGMAIKAIGR
jgi:O-antigen/teichoic acid export membrane protein